MRRAELVGRGYTLPVQEVTEADARAYAAATGAAPERSVDRGYAPPMFAVRLVAGLWRAVYQDPVLDTEDHRVLHAEQRMLFAGDLTLGAAVHVRGWIRDVVGFGMGDAALIRSVLTDDAGRTLVSMECTLAIPGGTWRPADRRRARPLPRGTPVCTESRRLDTDAPKRYADAADDHNPLHLDDAAARTAGHPSRIVHGMCTLATGFAALDERLTSPASRVRYLRARFSKPVLPGSEVSYTAHATRAPGNYAVTATCGGRPVLKNTWLRVGSATL